MNRIGLLLLTLYTYSSVAQYKHQYISQSQEEKLMSEVRSIIYRTYDNPQFGFNHHAAVFTMLSAVINEKGKLSRLNFSNSADTAFKAGFEKSPMYNKAKANINQLAKIKQLKSITLIIPVYYEPNWELNPDLRINYSQLEDFSKFGEDTIKGPVIFFEPVKIMLLSKGNS